MNGYPSAAELLPIMAQTKFDSFTEGDWYAFAGCETKNPLIGYYNEFTIVIDGNKINMVHSEDEYGGELYELNCLYTSN